MSEEIEVTPYDPVEYLKTEAEQIQFLIDCAELNDAKALALGLRHVARARGGMTELARQSAVTHEALYLALPNTGNPNLETVMRVLSALGLHMTFAPNEKVAA